MNARANATEQRAGLPFLILPNIKRTFEEGACSGLQEPWPSYLKLRTAAPSSDCTSKTVNRRVICRMS